MSGFTMFVIFGVVIVVVYSINSCIETAASEIIEHLDKVNDQLETLTFKADEIVSELRPQRPSDWDHSIGGV